MPATAPSCNAAAVNPDQRRSRASRPTTTLDGKESPRLCIGLFFAFWSWVGFEMAPNYAEESRDPKRIVPLSLYISVLGLGIFYIIISWAAVSSYPDAQTAIAKAANDSRQLLLRSGGACSSASWVARS